MGICKRWILGGLVALGCMLLHAVPAGAAEADMLVAYHQPASERNAGDGQALYPNRLASAWAQGVALPYHEQPVAGLTAASDDETVFHRIKHSVGAATGQAAGALTRPAPKMGGLMLVLLSVFALVLGILSLRWHRETAA